MTKVNQNPVPSLPDARVLLPRGLGRLGAVSLLVLSILLVLPPVASAGSDLRASQLKAGHSRSGIDSYRLSRKRLSEPPSKYRSQSILRYSIPIGDTGLVFRVKAPLRPGKIVKFELRF